MQMDTLSKIKFQILESLSHPEAEEGLYFQNLHQLHEDEERTQVVGSEEEILDALLELIQDGQVAVDDSGERLIFSLIRA